MFLSICATWARVKKVINSDDWYFTMVLGFIEILVELGILVWVLM